MTLGFLVLRKGFLKVVGATIQAALERGHRPVLIWDPVEPKPGESVTEADLRAWPGVDRIVWERRTPLLPLLRSAGVEALLAPSLHYVLQTSVGDEGIAALAGAGIGLYSVDYVFETVTSAPEAYRVIDITFYMSRFQRELHRRLYADRFAALGSATSLAARSAISGSTMLDQLAIVDRAAVRRRYGLAPHQPVALFMSLKMAVPDPWRRLVWGEGPRGWRDAQGPRVRACRLAARDSSRQRLRHPRDGRPGILRPDGGCPSGEVAREESRTRRSCVGWPTRSCTTRPSIRIRP